MIVSINGSKEVKDIREFVDKYMLATDARDLRKEYARVQPDVNLTFKYYCMDTTEDKLLQGYYVKINSYEEDKENNN